MLLNNACAATTNKNKEASAIFIFFKDVSTVTLQCCDIVRRVTERSNHPVKILLQKTLLTD